MLCNVNCCYCAVHVSKQRVVMCAFNVDKNNKYNGIDPFHTSAFKPLFSHSVFVASPAADASLPLCVGKSMPVY